MTDSNNIDEYMGAVMRCLKSASKFIVVGCALSTGSCFLAIFVGAGLAPKMVSIPFIAIPFPALEGVLVLIILSTALGIVGWLYLRQGCQILITVVCKISQEGDQSARRWWSIREPLTTSIPLDDLITRIAGSSLISDVPKIVSTLCIVTIIFILTGYGGFLLSLFYGVPYFGVESPLTLRIFLWGLVGWIPAIPYVLVLFTPIRQFGNAKHMEIWWKKAIRRKA
ncbi:MAG: hypothetical protein ACXAC2_22005 [Candidatus Kariarchaeaceae archaeon]|jgi:hypothetical protein